MAYDVHVSRTKAQTEVELLPAVAEVKKGVAMTAGGYLNGSNQVGREQAWTIEV